MLPPAPQALAPAAEEQEVGWERPSGRAPSWRLATGPHAAALTVWAAAAHALLQCSALAALPPALAADGLLMSPAGQAAQHPEQVRAAFF